MIDIYILAGSIFLLAILLVLLPLRLTWKGKGIVTLSGAGIGFLAYIGLPMFSYWVIFPIIVLLSALLSYIMIKNVEMFKASQMNNEIDHGTGRLFNYEELKEKALKAETIDNYYIDPAKLQNDAEKHDFMFNEMSADSSHLMAQDEIDAILQRQWNETAAATEEADEITEVKTAEDFSIQKEEQKMDLSKNEGLDPNSISLIKLEKVSVEDNLIDYSNPDVESNREAKITGEPKVLGDLLEEDGITEVKILNKIEFALPKDEQPQLDRTEHQGCEDLLEEIDFSRKKLDFNSIETDDKIEHPVDDGESQENVLAYDPDVHDDLLEEIDFTQRLAGATMVREETNIADLALTTNDTELLEIRKQIFEQLDDVKPFKVEELIKDHQIEDTQKQSSPDDSKTDVANRFSSSELEAAFDDLEELYLKKKATEKKVEVEQT